MALTEERAPTGATDGQGGQMTLIEHLAELRKRIIICVIALVITTVATWFLYNWLITFMEHPYCQYILHHPHKAIGGNPHSCDLYTRSPTEGFSARLKVSTYGGVALAVPVLFWELWRFITPGLKKNEKRYIIPFTLAAAVLFALGVTIAILVFPKVLNWLISVGGHGVSSLFSPGAYFSLYTLMCLIFGLVFLYPLVVVALELTGVVPSKKWRQWRRPAIVVIAAIAAIIIPSNDPFSFMAMSIPMYIFYELAIIVGRILKK